MDEQTRTSAAPAASTSAAPDPDQQPDAPSDADLQPDAQSEAELDGTPGFAERGRMRRRARFLRKARELAYRDLGGLVFDLHRFGQRNDALVLAKLDTIDRIDGELRTLEAALAERRPVTVLREAGIAACPRCAAIHGSDDRFCPNCGLAMNARAERPVAGPAGPAGAYAGPAATAPAVGAPPTSPPAVGTPPIQGAPPTTGTPPTHGPPPTTGAPPTTDTPPTTAAPPITHGAPPTTGTPPTTGAQPAGVQAAPAAAPSTVAPAGPAPDLGQEGGADRERSGTEQATEIVRPQRREP